MRQPSLYSREQWRSGPVSLGVAALAISGAIILALLLWFRDPSPGSAMAAPEQSAHGFEYRLSQEAVPLSGTREKLLVLERWTTGGEPASGAAVNLLIVDSEDASNRWMFPDNGQTILTRHELHAVDGVYSPVVGLVLTVANTGGESQRQSLYYYRVGGGPAVRFLTADTIVSAEQAGGDRYLVVYRDGARTTAAVYSLVDFKALAEKNIPDVPQ